jgi:CheY-like chemotaxis protein
LTLNLGSIELTLSRSIRLLLADDDDVILAASALCFEMAGFDVQTAPDGAAALEQYNRWQPNVALLDLEIPVIDACAVARQIRRYQVGSRPLLIALSASASATEREESMRSGFDFHFTKPIQIPQLMATIEAAATNKR